MKYIAFMSVVAFLAVNNMACEKSNNGCTTNGTIVLPYKKPIILLPNCSNSHTVNLTHISDSRCALHTECIWEGTVDANVQIDSAVIISLAFGKTKDTVINSQSYQLTLTNVTPYPDANKPILVTDYTAEIKVVVK